jgi:hypothetical protein
MSRLEDVHDLGLNIPSMYRGSDETRNEYIARAITNYNAILDAFMTDTTVPEILGEGVMSRRVKKSRKGKKKKNKFSKRRKTQLKEDK